MNQNIVLNMNKLSRWYVVPIGVHNYMHFQIMCDVADTVICINTLESEELANKICDQWNDPDMIPTEMEILEG